VAASRGESAAAVGRPAGGSVGPRSASEAGRSAVKNAGLALSDVAKGLNALFKPRPGTLGSGPSFDEDTYAAAKPYFQAGLAHVRQAGADIVEMMRALIAALRDQFGMDKDTIAAMKPYVLRYISDVKAGREAIEETNPQELKKDKLQQQQDAEPIKVIVGDKANIDATLPFLTEGQREDVLFAEKRWAAPDGYGVLFTNGTGTGKTFLALGAIKRLTKQGKGNGIVVVPNEAVMNEWVRSAPALGLQIKPLTDTKDAGSGIAITTYANFGQNDEIAKRDYDFVAIDEAHLLMLGKDAEATLALHALRAVSLHPDGVLQRAEMQNRGLVDRIERTRKEIDSITRSVSSLDTMQQVLEAAQRRVGALSKELDADVKEWRAILERTKADVMARQGEKRSRVMFLSATPFAYEPSIQWGEGFLYDFPEVSGRGYNAPSGYQKFMMQHFGWRMRNGKLTQPPAEVDSDLMQRQFNTWLRKEGVLSARMLDVDHDYERKFILIQGGVGQTIDDGLRWLRETDNGRYWSLYHAINEKFDYLTRSRLLEAIKARAAIPYIKKHHALGRKVVVFYDFNSGGGINVFNLGEQLKQAEAAERMPGYDVEKDGVDVPARGQGAAAYGQIKTERVPRSQLIREFMAARPELQAIDFSQYGSPLTTLLQAFPGAGVYNGMGQYKKTRVQSIRDFNDDAKPEANLLLVQKTANAGWSGHDTTGKHGRVVINLGLPVAPIEAIQQEGRIYRVGQKSDANFQYFNTGTNWERYAFGSKIARRAGTAENLAMGEQARGLREAFIQAFENSDPDYEPGEADGRGGKVGDRDLVSAITEWDRARSLYFAQQKKTARTKAAEGEDYYATPEPLGLKMVEWAGILPGDRVLEPSAGHGAIARWFPDKNDRTVIEQSLELASRLTLATDAKLVNDRFENHDTINKYDAIVMNPPFGTGGKMAVEHLDKAFGHLTDGGRLVALIPDIPSANKRFDDWLHGDKQIKAKPVTSNLGTFGAVFLGDTATVEVSGMAGIAGGVLGASTVTGKVTGFREGKLFVQREGDAWATGYRPDQIRAVQPTGARTATVKSAPTAYLRASIGLPGVTFERAGTGVKTRVVIIDKITEQSRLKGLRTQDSREIEAASVKELFERIENMDVVGRSLPADKARVQKREADRDFAKAANAGKMDDAGIVQPSGAPATVESIQEPEKPGDPRKLLTDAPRVEHVTKAGKTIFGVIAKRLTKDQARSIDPYMWARDGGFFIRMAHVVRPPNVAEQERAVYNVNEPDSITKDVFRGATSDLFAGTEHALSNAGRSDVPGRKSLTTSPAHAAAGPAARVLAVRQAPDTPGIYYVSTQLVTVGERELPVERIRTTEDAAKAFAYLPRWAVEHYDAIVTDKDGKPLAIIGGFKGDVGAVGAPLSTLIGELSRIDGAKSLWTAHNHPSGLAALSANDTRLDKALQNALDGSGIQYHGLFAMTGAGSRAGVVKYDHTIVGGGEVRVTKRSPVKVPVVDRELIDRRDDVEKLEGPAESMRIIPQIAGDRAGVVFVDSQNGVSSFVPFSGEEMGSMRVHGRLMSLFRAASKANARGAVIADPGGKLSERQKNNLKTALSHVDVRLLDVIVYGSGMNPASLAQVGKEPGINPGAVVFSLGDQTLADDLAQQERWLSDRARAAGFAGIDEMAVRDYPAFEKLAEQWRRNHPADALYSRNGTSGYSPADRAVFGMASEGKGAAEILAFLSKASRRPFNRLLATALQKAGLQTAVTSDSQGGWQVGNRSYAQKYAAAYSPKADKVALFTPRDAERHVLHELVHAATLKAIAVGGVSAMRMRALFKHVQKSGKLDGQYGMRNLDEFVAEVFSNPKFRDALQGVPAPANSALKNAWQWFVRIVARIVGIRTQPSETALDRALREGVALMQENAAIRAADEAVRFNLDTEDQFAATERKVGGRAAYDKAKAAGQTKLNYRQWVQVRTPAFKAWFGDWEVRANNARVSDQLEKWEKGNLSSGTIIQIGHPGSILQQFGFPDAPIHLTQRVLTKAVKQKHEVGLGDLRDLAMNIQAPLAIFKSKAGPDHRVVVTEARHEDGNIVVVMDLQATRNGVEINDIRSIHPKRDSSIANWIDDGLLIGLEKGKGREWLENSAGSNSQQSQVKATSDEPILYDASGIRNVSKVVDPETGEPMEATHTTKALWTVFDETKASTSAVWGPGIYLSVDAPWSPSGQTEEMRLFVRSRNLLDITQPLSQGATEKLSSYVGRRVDAAPLLTLEKKAGSVTAGAKAAGFDGILHYGPGSTGRHLVVFEPEQIKSATGNRGTFDATDPDIRFNVAGTQPAVTPPASPGNLWQAAKAKAAALLTPGRIDKLIYELQDKYVDLRRIRDHIREIGGTITDLNDAYLGEELYHKRLAHRTQDFLKAELRPLLADMKTRGVGMQELESFLHARHAPEANAEMAKRNPNQAEIDAGRRKAAAVVHRLERNLQTAQARGLATKAIEQALNDARGDLVKWNGAQAFSGTEQERRSLSGMTDQAAAAIMAGLSPQRRADLDALAARVDDINSGTLQLLDDYGLMSGASLDAWRRTYQFYVPLHRDEAHPDSANHPVGQGFSVKGDAAKRRTGSNQKVTHILGHIAMQREAALTRGEKNRVMLKLYLMARQNRLPDVWKVGAVPMLDTIDKATGFVKSVPDPLYKSRPNVVTLRIAGKDVAITMNEHNPQALRMAQALKNLDVDDLHYIIPIVGKMTRWFASINTQYNPIFGVINMMRDLQAGALNLSTTELAGKQGQVLKDSLRILSASFKNYGRLPTTGPWAALSEDLNMVGGMTGYRDLFLTAEDRSKTILEEMKALDRGGARKAFHAVASWLSDYNEAMETAVRLAAYKAGLDSGMTKERAASLAKNLTVNFNRKGRQTRELGALYAFFNAAVQGTTRMAQTLAGPAGRKIMAGGVLAGAVSTVMGIAAMGGGDGEDDEWSKIPEFVKERSLIIPIGRGKYITIPMPLGFHFLPNIGRLAVEMAVYKDKTAGRQMASLATVLADAFNPLGGSAPALQIAAPTVLDPFVALAQNRDWTGKPIYIENFNSLDQKPGTQRAKDSATPWAKGFAEAINAITGGTEYTPGGWSPTPDQIDYVIGQLTGGLGREAGKVAATAAAPFTGEELPPYRIPLLGRLYGSTGGTSGQSEAFYERIRQANAAESEIKGRLKDGGGIAAYLQEHPHALELAALGNAAERQVRELRGIRRGILSRGEPDAASRAREVNERMAAVMRGFNRQAERMQ
jgi:hypothetical protein